MGIAAPAAAAPVAREDAGEAATPGADRAVRQPAATPAARAAEAPATAAGITALEGVRAALRAAEAAVPAAKAAIAAVRETAPAGANLPATAAGRAVRGFVLPACPGATQRAKQAAAEAARAAMGVLPAAAEPAKAAAAPFARAAPAAAVRAARAAPGAVRGTAPAGVDRVAPAAAGAVAPAGATGTVRHPAAQPVPPAGATVPADAPGAVPSLAAPPAKTTVLEPVRASPWPCCKKRRKGDPIMIEMQRIPLEENFRNTLEGLHYKNLQAQQIIAYMLSGNYDIDSDAFRRYEERHYDSLAQEEMMKDKISREILPPALRERGSRWEVDFASGEVVVYGG